MATESLAACPAATDERARVRSLVHEASEPVAQFWPMKRFVHHNPIHGLEHLPFDRAVREARHLLGGNGYLPVREYREMYRTGRITAGSLEGALAREGPAREHPGDTAVRAGARQVDAAGVWRAHLLHGFDPLEPMLQPWTLSGGGALERFQDDLPEETRRRVLERWTAREGAGPDAATRAYLHELWDAAVQATAEPSGHDSEEASGDTVAVELPAGRTIGDWLEVLAGTSIVEPINAQMIKWVSAFVDEGMAGWAMPSREGGLYRAWRELSPFDLSGALAGIDRWADRLASLPETAEAALAHNLRRMDLPEERWAAYLSRHLAQLPGWSGLVRWLGESPAYPGQEGHPADLVDYLAIRLFYEAELAESVCRKHWRIEGTLSALAAYWRRNLEEYRRLVSPRDAAHGESLAICRRAWPLFRLAQFFELLPGEIREMTPAAVGTLLGWIEAFPDDRHGPVWLEAYEDSYRLGLMNALAAHREANPPAEAGARPRAQLIFCIDVRSESIRRHVEAQGPYETFGYAGFFGVPMNHEAFDGDERFPLCPVLLTPKHAVDETVRPDEGRHLQGYASGTSWLGLGHSLFHDLKLHPMSSLALVDSLGFFFGAGLAGKTLAPAWHQSMKDTLRGWFRPGVGTKVDVGGSSASTMVAPGFTLEEQAAMVEGGLRTIGLTERLGRFVVVCGHGSESDNNPYFGALHCGACGGKHGDANARAFAAMANSAEVRAMLASRGLPIPDDTWFLPAKHITTSDRIEFYDLGEMPPGHREDLAALRGDLERAGAAQALERCGRIPGARQPSAAAAWRHVNERTMDWANTRPEWGLAGNAAFIIGRRSLTKGLSLRGRAFLHSYNPDPDLEGAILEKIMTAPLVVGQWINMEHYFSAVDPWFWGSGSKIIHNVVSGVGVMLGNQSDLQTGLPLQTVNDGAVHFHEPVRLLTVIEAPADRISRVIGRHEILQGLFHNQWLNLVSIDPATFAVHRYRPDATWEAVRTTGHAGTGARGPVPQ